MRKVVFIGFLIILTSGCSVFNKRTKSAESVSDNIKSESFIESVEEQNITNGSFYIQKLDLTIETKDGVSEKLLGSFKFESPDKYLISIKSRTGIEAVRIFIDKDTILVNDRINKKLYRGSVGQMKFKYGLSVSVIPVIFGDVILDKTAENMPANCSEGSMEINTFLNGARINYNIDYHKQKLKKSVILGSLNKEIVDILYSDYLKHSKGIIPGTIRINDLQRQVRIDIRFRNIESPWDGKIDFIPGKQYEILELP